MEKKARVLMELLTKKTRTGPPPTSAIKDAREAIGMRQVDLALKSGVSQSYISELEQGKTELRPEWAWKLAPVLRMDPAELEAAEGMSSLHRAAIMGDLGLANVQLLQETILDLAAASDDDEISKNLLDAMVQILKAALEKVAEQEGLDDAGSPVTLKSEEGGIGPDRDTMGRRVHKPFGGS